MAFSLVYTTEPLATRALAAEIRHDHTRFTARVSELIPGATLGQLADVSAEKSGEKVDVAMTFTDPSFVVGIEAKFDHALTEDQVDRELTVADHLVVLLLDASHAPEWLSRKNRASLMTWEQALACLPGSRLTLAEVRAARFGKNAVDVPVDAGPVRHPR